MRRLAQALVCVFAAAAVAGCNPINDKRYMDEGAGVELGYSSIADATARQDVYVREICKQAGFSMPESSDRTVSCLDRSGWNEFVMAGIVDIKGRCDNYLTWLDSRRRDRAPVLKELLAVTGATNSILTASGADTTTLGIVSAAMALAGATYENWNSRLLLAINQSTVVDIVYSRQQQFMDSLRNKNFDSRPAALYVLRDYLRLCMPTTIEADINTSITLVQRGSLSDARERPIVPLAGVPSAAQYLPPPRAVSVTVDNPLSDAEKTISRTNGILVQTVLKVQNANGDFGPVGSETRQKLQSFKYGYYSAQSLVNKGPLPDPQSIDGIIKGRTPEVSAVNRLIGIGESCKTVSFTNNYELGVVIYLQTQAGGPRGFFNKELEREHLVQQIAPGALAGRRPCEVHKDIREAIGKLRARYGLASGDAIDESFIKAAVGRPRG